MTDQWEVDSIPWTGLRTTLDRGWEPFGADAGRLLIRRRVTLDHVHPEPATLSPDARARIKRQIAEAHALSQPARAAPHGPRGESAPAITPAEIVAHRSRVLSAGEAARLRVDIDRAYAMARIGAIPLTDAQRQDLAAEISELTDAQRMKLANLTRGTDAARYLEDGDAAAGLQRPR